MSETRKYTEEFKKQIVMLYNNGKSGIELAREYGMTKSAIYDWAKKYNQSGLNLSKEDLFHTDCGKEFDN